MAGFLVEVSDEEIRQERQKARALRDGQWWKRKRASGLCHHCGGKSTKGNVVPSCKDCNSTRKHRLPFESADD